MLIKSNRGGEWRLVARSSTAHVSLTEHDNVAIRLLCLGTPTEAFEVNILMTPQEAERISDALKAGK